MGYYDLRKRLIAESLRELYVESLIEAKKELEKEKIPYKKKEKSGENG